MNAFHFPTRASRNHTLVALAQVAYAYFRLNPTIPGERWSS